MAVIKDHIIQYRLKNGNIKRDIMVRGEAEAGDSIYLNIMIIVTRSFQLRNWKRFCFLNILFYDIQVVQGAVFRYKRIINKT